MMWKDFWCEILMFYFFSLSLKSWHFWTFIILLDIIPRRNAFHCEVGHVKDKKLKEFLWMKIVIDSWHINLNINNNYHVVYALSWNLSYTSH